MFEVELLKMKKTEESTVYDCCYCEIVDSNWFDYSIMDLARMNY